jgi:hypothetical protein
MPQEGTRPVQKTVQIIDLVSEEELPASEEEFFSDVEQGDEKTTDAKNANAKIETKANTMTCVSPPVSDEESCSNMDEDDKNTTDEKDATAKTETKTQTTPNESENAKPDDNEHGLGEKRKREDTPATLQDGAKSTCL